MKSCWIILLVLTVWPDAARAILPVHAELMDIDSGTTSPAGNYRWMDAADQVYAESYQVAYNYTQAHAAVDFHTNAATLYGTLTAFKLKPNFVYQLKLLGNPHTDPAANERIGLTGRWWQEEWAEGGWTNGHNLNNKGDGSSPNPNDLIYYSLRDIEEPTSPTGRKYRFTGYRVIDYFITDPQGNALLFFETDSSYHVLFKTSQRSRTADDGSINTAIFDVSVTSPAYDTDYGEAAVSVFGEWERLPADGVFLSPGDYHAAIVLTEESFHGSGLAGGWAAAMGTDVQFTLLPESEVCRYSLVGDLTDDCRVDFDDVVELARHWLIDCRVDPTEPACTAE